MGWCFCQHRKPKYCTVSSCKIWSKELSSTRWLILTRKLGKLCKKQQTALEWCLWLSAWCRCDFNVSTYSILNMWSTILPEIFKLPIKAKANITVWSTNSHIRLTSDFYPPSQKKSTIKEFLYRHISICLIQFNMFCALRFLLPSPLPPERIMIKKYWRLMLNQGPLHTDICSLRHPKAPYRVTNFAQQLLFNSLCHILYKIIMRIWKLSIFEISYWSCIFSN